MANSDCCLISTIHDPESKLAEPIRRYLPALRYIYPNVIFSVTDRTHEDVIFSLGNCASVGPTSGHANGRRRALRLGLESGANTFHYCDSDRILFWIATCPDELAELVGKVSHTDKLVILERTGEAWQSHPFLQRLTEGTINRTFQNGHYIDYLTGSRIIPRNLAVKILGKSRAKNAAALDVEWPLIVGADSIIRVSVNGLAYEHRLWGLEKSLGLEVKVRLDNMFSALRLYGPSR